MIDASSFRRCLDSAEFKGNCSGQKSSSLLEVFMVPTLVFSPDTILVNSSRCPRAFSLRHKRQFLPGDLICSRSTYTCPPTNRDHPPRGLNRQSMDSSQKAARRLGGDICSKSGAEECRRPKRRVLLIETMWSKVVLCICDKHRNVGITDVRQREVDKIRRCSLCRSCWLTGRFLFSGCKERGQPKYPSESSNAKSATISFHVFGSKMFDASHEPCARHIRHVPV